MDGAPGLLIADALRHATMGYKPDQENVLVLHLQLVQGLQWKVRDATSA